MSPSKARHLARHSCWFKAMRTANEAVDEARTRLLAGEARVAIYRCPLSHRDDIPHFHLCDGEGHPPSDAQINEVIAVLGDDAYRRNDA